MKKKIKLNSLDLGVLRQFKSKFEEGLNQLEKARQFKEGDFLILYLEDGYDQWGHKLVGEIKMKPKVNAYGALTKYLVVHVSEHGIPFIKQVNKAGNPIGPLFSCLGTLDSDHFRFAGQRHEFTLDPDYVDSMLLQNEYDPSSVHKEKHDNWKEITSHNKKYKVKTSNVYSIEDFLSKNVKIGDMLWRSNATHWLVQNKLTLSRAEAEKLTKNYSDIRKKNIIVLEIKDNKNRIKYIDSYSLLYAALYTERPKTYKELNT